jgi:hypothetical protein
MPKNLSGHSYWLHSSRKLEFGNANLEFEVIFPDFIRWKAEKFQQTLGFYYFQCFNFQFQYSPFPRIEFVGGISNIWQGEDNFGNLLI